MTEPTRPRPGAALRVASVLFVAACVASLALHATVRDSLRVTAPFHYASPPVVAALWGFAGAALAVARRARSLAGVGIVAGCAAAAWAVALDLRTGGAAVAPASPDVADDRRPLVGLLWNVQRGRGGWDAAIAHARAADPDLLVLAEGPDHRSPAAVAAWTGAFPGHVALALPGDRLVLVRGTVERLSPRRLDHRVPLLRAVCRGRTFRVMPVDVASNPFHDRAKRLRPILERVRADPDGRLLVLGDFNTPRDSAHFDAWRGPLRHAFEAAGTGWGATWPTLLPVLSIDHVWAGGGIEILSCTIGGSAASDHRPVRFTFDVR